MLASLTGRAAPRETFFEVRAPEGMVTGRVRLQAVTRDGEVAFVKWQIEDWSRTTSRPFEFFLDVGPVPFHGGGVPGSISKSILSQLIETLSVIDSSP